MYVNICVYIYICIHSELYEHTLNALMVSVYSYEWPSRIEPWLR